jgi:hypothetical protein
MNDKNMVYFSFRIIEDNKKNEETPIIILTPTKIQSIIFYSLVGNVWSLNSLLNSKTNKAIGSVIGTIDNLNRSSLCSSLVIGRFVPSLSIT